jgi:hypothetical protein
VYLDGSADQMLPMEHAGIMFSPRPAPVLAESGLAGGVVAVRLDALEAVEGAGGAVVLVPKGSGRPRPGDVVAWCQVTVVAPAVLDVDGDVAVDGFLPDHVRLGVLERHLGGVVVEQVVAESQTRPLVAGEEPPQRRQRVMSLALTVRMLLLMGLLPTASYVEVLTQLVGPLPRLPWARTWQVPSSTVVTTWRRHLGPDVMRRLFQRVAGPIVAATEPGGAWRGLRVCAIDGFQANLPDSDENRAEFGSSGTAKGGRGPFPQLRAVVATAHAGRALLAAAMDACRVGELSLAGRLLAEHPDLFTPGHVYVLDRYFAGYDFLYKLYQGGRGAHFAIRMKSNANLPMTHRLSSGDYLSYLRLRDGRSIKIRVVEYDVRKSDGTTSELFCIATTLLDSATYPKNEIADLYHQRWSASETTIGESKSTITDAAGYRGPHLRSESPDLVRQEFWAWLAATQLVRRVAHAATTTTTGVRTDQISFTTARREATRSVTHGLVTATTSPAALADASNRAARGMLANLLTTDRDRHSPRKQKWRPAFPHTTTTKTTIRGPLTPRFEANRRPDTS